MGALGNCRDGAGSFKKKLSRNLLQFVTESRCTAFGKDHGRKCPIHESRSLNSDDAPTGYVRNSAEYRKGSNTPAMFSF